MTDPFKELTEAQQQLLEPLIEAGVQISFDIVSMTELRSQLRGYTTADVEIPDVGEKGRAEYDALIKRLLVTIGSAEGGFDEFDPQKFVPSELTAASSTLTRMILDADKEFKVIGTQAYNINRAVAYERLPGALTKAQEDAYLASLEADEERASLVEVEIAGQKFNVSPTNAATLAQRGYEYNNLSAAEASRLHQDMHFFNNLSAAQIANLDLQLRAENRLDDTLAFEIEESQRNFAESQRQFRTDVALQTRQLDAQFAGLELEQRGQMAAALAQDFAMQMELGQMTYQEARLNLDRIDTALNQRRAEREAVLELAVARSSLIKRDGETLTRLPGARQLASLLSDATGQTFDPEGFGVVPTQVIDPQQAGQNVLDSSAFESPIPGLVAGLQGTREAITGILGAPLNTANEAASAAIAEGISG